MLDRLESIKKRYEELSQLLAQPEIATDLKQLQELSKERASIEDLVNLYQQYKVLFHLKRLLLGGIMCL